MGHETEKQRRSAEDEHLDERLDEALEETFPASDPVAVHEPKRSAAAPESKQVKKSGAS